MRALIAGMALLLSGCWVPPSANVRPQGAPRVLAQGIVERVLHLARVESVDPAARTITLSMRGIVLPAYQVGPGVRHWRDSHVGDQVRAVVEEVVTVYLPPAGESGRRSPDARVLDVDPSYRLLTVQYPNGGTETFKMGLRTRMRGIEAGDWVAIRPLQAVEVCVRHHANRGTGLGSSTGATPAC